MNLQYFSDQDFYFSIKKFFKDLNIPVHYMTEQPASAEEIISNTFKPKNPAHQMIGDVYFLGMVDDRAFNNQPSIIDDKQLKKEDYDGLLVFGITLDRQDGKLPTRGQMAEVVRVFNREFHYTPVVIVFKYGRYISFSNCERIPYKQEWREGEKAGKVSLLIDIDTVDTHTGHLKILQNLAITTSGKKAVTTFDGLYNYWQEVFSVSLLSKRFYQELSNWYFWALKHVEFPDDEEKDREVRNATSVIRLITRLMFVWFLKEKKLVPDALFDKDELDEHLNYKDYHNSTYYKAILQNLFFATLNTKMKKDNLKSRKFVHRQYGVQEFYRYERFFKNKKKALKLFETIPFLNGGLFENLDKNIGKPDEVRIDCFSNRPVHEKRLEVPDFLFFGGEVPIDLSKELGSKKRKNETARGIIHILNSYKFTIAENTPVEEEIALDPELLGKVFENLLASYNPETRTTARKQTGSFYTPREIVNYMVDESLIAYLEGKLIESFQKKAGLTQKTPPSQKIMFGKQKPTQTKIVPSESTIPPGVTKEINDKLRHLLSYSTEDHHFAKKEVKTLINALDNSKILDPACGSGAFPMGILHKMVHILSKIDPQNKQWKQRQIENQTRQIKQDISHAEKIKDNKARQKAMDELEERLATINDAFDTNELDFGRKLYLIENCIFGVDIQAIAVQIAKLRFFISLIVDQIVDENKENLGIIPLPNLETKFVAANTLIEVDKPETFELFGDTEINKLEKELKQIRHKHFHARTPETKEKWRDKDKDVRVKINNKLRELYSKELARQIKNSSEQRELENYELMMERFKDNTKKQAEYAQKKQSCLEKIEEIKNKFNSKTNKTAQQLASWDLYDQNISADFFDMEWMFGVKDGFDIVIGNPPYINALDFNALYGNELRRTLSETYRSARGAYDIFVLFFERSINLLVSSGVLSFITPNKYLSAKYALSLRKFLLKTSFIYHLVDVSGIRVFEESAVYPVLTFLCKASSVRASISSIRVFLPNRRKSEKFVLENFRQTFVPTEMLRMLPENIWGFLLSHHIALLPKLTSSSQPLKELGEINATSTAAESDNYGAFLTNKSGSDMLKVINTGTIDKFVSLWGHKELTHSGAKFLTPRLPLRKASVNERRRKMYKSPKIIFAKMAKTCEAFVDKNGEYASLNTNCFYMPRRDVDLKFIGGICNSYIFMFLYNLFFGALRMSGGYYQFQAPQLRVTPVAYTEPSKQVPISKLVDKILSAKHADHSAKTTGLEAEIDARVAHLYNLTEEEYSLILKETNCPDPFRVAALNVYRDIARGKIK